MSLDHRRRYRVVYTYPNGTSRKIAYKSLATVHKGIATEKAITDGKVVATVFLASGEKIG